MPRFFNRIRRQLAKDNKFFQYSRYAIGEILLVVVGILIAIQIDNWNTSRSNDRLEESILLGIKDDLLADMDQMENRFRRSYRDLHKNIELFDSIRILESNVLNIKYVDSIFSRCIRQRNTFFPVSGTYQSVLSNGQSDLIKNKELFKDIQGIYDVTYSAIQASGNRIDALTDKIRYEYRDITSLNQHDRLELYKDQSARNDIEHWKKLIDNFAGLIDGAESRIENIISQIDKELVDS